MNIVSSALLAGEVGVGHGFFGRQGGVSQGLYASLNCGPGSADTPAAVAENRDRARKALHAASVNTLYQIHSAEAVIVDQPWAAGAGPKADGMATRVAGIALGVLTADCAPVLLLDGTARVIGAAHAGWKGALGGVLPATIAAMQELGADPARVHAAIGPCIGQDAYEVGPEFFDQFALANPRFECFFVPAPRSKHWQFDLQGFVADQLRQAGVARIDVLDLCTYENEADYFSYRRATHRTESDYGRNLSAIVLQ